MRKSKLLISCLLVGTLGLSGCSSLIYKIYHTHSYEQGDESVLYVDGEWYQYCTICGGLGDVINNTTGYTHVVDDAEGLLAAFQFDGTTVLTSNITLNSVLSVESGMVIELNLNYYDLTLPSGMVIDGDLAITSSPLRAESSNPIESEDEEEEDEEDLDYYDIVTYADEEEDDDDDDEDEDPDTETEPGPVEEPVPTGGAEEITVSGQGIIVNSTGTLGVIDDILIDTTDCSSLITVNGGLVNLYSGEVSSEIDGTETDECAIEVTNAGTLNISGGDVDALDIGVLASGNGVVSLTSGTIDGEHAGVIVNDATLNVTGGTISSSQGQGIIARESTSTAEINVSGVDTTISAPNGAGILLFNSNCTTLINGPYITGLTGVEVHAGSVEIDGRNTYVVGNGAFSVLEDEEPTSENTNSICGCGVAIVVDEDSSAEVVINNGNIIGGDNLQYAIYEGDGDSDVSLSVTGGFIYGQLEVDVEGFITGGTFGGSQYSDLNAFIESGLIATGYTAMYYGDYYVVLVDSTYEYGD